MKYGFIGVGNMGGALVKCLLQTTSPADVLLCEHNPEKMTAFLKQGCLEVNELQAFKADYIFLGVKPYAIKDLLKRFKATNNSTSTLVTMAAGLAISEYQEIVTNPIIRIMPNIPVASGDGVILIDYSKDVSQDQKQHLKQVLNKAGSLIDLPEKYFEAASSVAGCSPAFIAMFIEAMADGGVECGLPRQVALQLAETAVAGTANYLLKTKTHPGALKDAVCSPGGTTIVGVHALEKGGFRNATIDSIVESYQKSCNKK